MRTPLKPQHFKTSLNTLGTGQQWAKTNQKTFAMTWQHDKSLAKTLLQPQNTLKRVKTPFHPHDNML